MPFELMGAYLNLPIFLLVASRLGGMIMFLPVFSGSAVPVNVRLLFVVGLAALVYPLVQVEAAAQWHPLGLAIALGRELLLGMLMGLVVQVCFLGLQLGGQMIAQETGLAFGEVVDPSTDVEQSLIGSFYVQLGAVLFLIVGGHRALVGAALESFRRIPLLGETPTTQGGVELLLDAIGMSGEIALRVAAPVLLTLFLLNVAMGFISRTLPQFNVLTVGFSVKGMVGFLLMAVALPAALSAFMEGLETTVDWVGTLTGS
jgi:flagellar biosynthesis protein FliR